MKFQTIKTNVLEETKTETLPQKTLLTFQERKEKDQKLKNERPLHYFFAVTAKEFFSDLYENLYAFFWRDPVYYIKYRTTHKYNILNTGLKPNYYGFDRRILYGLFNELVNFVECEKAWMNIVFGREKGSRGLFSRYRSPEHGIAYLKWEMGLEESPEQAENAKEILELYTWWKEVYLKRIDAMDASGWSDYCETMRKSGYDLLHSERKEPPELAEKGEIALEKMKEIEKNYENEEQEMLIRLIKIRKSLWT